MYNSLVPFRWDRNKRIKSLFDNLLDDDFFGELIPVQFSKAFRADIKETENEYVVEAELPGFAKEDIEVEVNDNNLVIRATRREEIDEEGRGYIRKERYSGNLERRFYIENIKPQEVTAKYENGILRVNLPKDKKSKSDRKVKIE